MGFRRLLLFVGVGLVAVGCSGGSGDDGAGGKAATAVQHPEAVEVRSTDELYAVPDPLDIARAARQLPGVAIGPRTAIAGYSQGGHAALWADELATDWTPDLDIVGTMAGAPASEVPDVVGNLPAELRDQGEALIAAGFGAAYPDVDLDQVLTPAGRKWAEAGNAGCAPARESPPGPLTKRRLADTDPWPQLLDDNRAGTKAAKTPLLIVHSAEDRNVPIASSATLLDRLCQTGQVVERRVLPTGDHVAAAVPAYDQAFDWFTQLAAGERPKSSC